jgi:hypothetical protein
MVLLWEPEQADGAQDLLAARASAQVTVARDRRHEARIYLFDHDVEALGLVEGSGRIEPDDPGRSALPLPLAAVHRDADGRLTVIDPPSAGLRLPTIDVAGVLASGRCLDPPLFVTRSCGATVALGLGAVARPALPRIATCAAGWSRGRLDVDRGVSLGPLSLELCRPPPRVSCAGPGYQAPGDAGCGPIGECGAGDFADDVPIDAVFVRPGPDTGDGSRARPYARVEQAVSAGARTIALARGRYDEPVRLSGDVNVVGACAERTALDAGVRLVAFRGELRGLHVSGSGQVVERSDARLRDVWLEARAGDPALSAAASTVAMEHARLDGSTRIEASRLILRAAHVGGDITSESSTVTIEDVMLAQTSTARPHHFQRSRLALAGSRLSGMVLLTRGVADVRGSWWSPMSSSAQPGALTSAYARVSVSSTVFEFGERRPAPGLDEVLIRLGTGPTTLQDVVCTGPTITTPGVHVGCLALYSVAPEELHQVRRLLISGGADYPQLGILGHVEAEDVSAYGAATAAVSVIGGRVSIARLELGRSDVGLHAAGGEAGLELIGRDFIVADASARAVVLRDGISAAPATIDLRRVWVGGARGGTAALSVRSARSGPEATLDATLRELTVESQHAVALELGLDVRLSLRNFLLSGAGTAIALRSLAPRANRRHELAYGTLRATVRAFDMGDSDDEIESLLDHVGVEAPGLGR